LASNCPNPRGDLDHSAIATFIEDMANIEIRKP